MSRFRIPADVDREDRLLAGLTARQLAILGMAAVALWFVYATVGRFVPPPVFAGLAAPVALAAAALALGRRDGLGADRLALAALRLARSPRRLVPDGEGADAPAWVAARTGSPPAPLRLPARDIDEGGMLDLGSDGAALVCAASSLNFGLRTEAEQLALVGAFGRFLNSQRDPLQVLVRAERVDLRAAVADLAERAGALPHPALEGCAREHAGFLADLSARRDVLRRQVLVVFREPRAGEAAASGLARRAEEARASLAAAGVTLRTLEGDEARAALARAADPEAPPGPEHVGAAADVVRGKA
jgi:hypothetical protein